MGAEMKLLAKILSHPRVANALINWAQKRPPDMNHLHGTTGWWLLPRFLLEPTDSLDCPLVPRRGVPRIFIIKHTEGDTNYCVLENLNIYTVILRGSYAIEEKIPHVLKFYKPGDVNHVCPGVPVKMHLGLGLEDWDAAWEIGIFRNGWN